MKFVSKESQNSNIIAGILNSTQQPGCVFETFSKWLPEGDMGTCVAAVLMFFYKGREVGGGGEGGS